METNLSLSQTADLAVEQLLLRAYTNAIQSKQSKMTLCPINETRALFDYMIDIYSLLNSRIEALEKANQSII